MHVWQRLRPTTPTYIHVHYKILRWSIRLCIKMSTNPLPQLPPPPVLPIAQLESLRFKANQIIESIQMLQRTLEAGGHSAMPAWPDVLSKYNILLSQSHNFSTALLAPAGTTAAASRVNGTGGGPAPNMYEKIALHPSTSMSDTQLDNELIPLLRNQQTTDVLRLENETVRRLSEHMVTRGSVGVLGAAAAPSASGPSNTNTLANVNPGSMDGGVGMGGAQKRAEYADVLAECAQIRGEHDRRVERAVRAVTMLRDKFDWKQRVEVEVEEPEELEWDPRARARAHSHSGGSTNGPEDGGQVEGGMAEDGDGDVGMDSPEGEGGQSSDEDEVEGELVDAMGLGEGEPTPTTPGTIPGVDNGVMAGIGGPGIGTAGVDGSS